MSTGREGLTDERDEARQVKSGSNILAFLMIGGLATLAFILLSGTMVGLFPKVESGLVSALSYASLVLPVYLLHRRFSFRSEAAHRQALPRYVAVQAMALALSGVLGFVVHDLLALPNLAGATLVAILIAAINFVVLKSWAFARAKGSATAS